MIGLIDTSVLTNIADAIRGKLGAQTTYKPNEMPRAIESISGGGITPTGTKSITANGTYDVASYASAEVNVPQSGITPTGTKQVSITANGTTTEDVTAYANAQITVNVVNQDYVNALTALGVTEDLTDSIEALTTYVNGVTGESDTTLSDAVHSLGSGYGSGSGGLEYEEGTYTPAIDELPIITFANSHSKAPDIIIFADVSAQASATGNTLTSFTYVNVSAMFGNPLQYIASVSWAEFYAYTRMASNLNGASGAALYNRDNVTASGFEPFAGTTTFICRQGQTYKWIAIWR